MYLIVPPSTYGDQRRYDVYRQTPLEGITSVALSLKDEGYEVSVLDTRNIENPMGWLLSREDYKDSLFVGMTTFFNSFRFVKEFAARFKREYPKIPFVIGGPMATAAYRQFLTWTDVDIVVLGEGEETAVELARQREMNQYLSSTPGTAVKTGNGVYRIKLQEDTNPNLDKLPLLDWSIYPDLKGRSFDFQYMVGRGCPNDCRYCFQITKEVKSKSPHRVEKELYYLKTEYGMSSVLFNDADLLNLTPCLSQLLESFDNLGMSWGCCSYPNELKPELLRMAYDAGCVNLRLGIESFDQVVLMRNGRNIDVQTMERNLWNAIDSDIQKITCYFVLGLPGETDHSLDQLIKKVEDFPRIIPRPFMLLVLPGTPIYDDAVKRGLIKDEEAYLSSLDELKLGSDDEILVNVSEASDEVLRSTFKSLLEIADERNEEVRCPITV